MKIIDMIKQNSYKTITIIGIAKNTGKTTTLNYLIKECNNNDIKVGLTSAGRDGEKIDLVTNTEKPPIYVYRGTIAAIAKKLLPLCSAKLEILENTNIQSALGEVMIVKIKESGYIEIAGATNTVDLKKLSQLLKSYGATLVIIDGAIDRKAVSSPIVTDACILATGAAISRDLFTLIEKTAYAVEKYNLRIADHIHEDGDIKYIKGALTTRLLKELCKDNDLKNIKIVVEDSTKIFVEIDVWKEYKKRGLTIEVKRKTNLLAISINPTSPEGHYFDSNILMQSLNKRIPNIKIIDVVSGTESN